MLNGFLALNAALLLVLSLCVIYATNPHRFWRGFRRVVVTAVFLVPVASLCFLGMKWTLSLNWSDGVWTYEKTMAASGLCFLASISALTLCDWLNWEWLRFVWLGGILLFLFSSFALSSTLPGYLIVRLSQPLPCGVGLMLAGIFSLGAWVACLFGLYRVIVTRDERGRRT